MHIVSGQNGMRFLTNAVYPASDERVGLVDGMRKMFDEGISALNSNRELDDAMRTVAKNELGKEREVCDEIAVSPCVVNGDVWSNRLDAEAGLQSPAKSIDLLVPVEEDGSLVILFVEGKLGLAPRELRSRLRNPSYADVVEKYIETKSKVCRRPFAAVCQTMYLIVPVAVREVARNTFTRRNKTNTSCCITPMDARGFLCEIGAIQGMGSFFKEGTER